MWSCEVTWQLKSNISQYLNINRSTTLMEPNMTRWWLVTRGLLDHVTLLRRCISTPSRSPNFTRWLKIRELQPQSPINHMTLWSFRATWPLNHTVIWGYVTNEKLYNSTSASFITTKYDRLVNFSAKPSHQLKARDCFIMSSFEVTWEIEPTYLHFRKASGHQTWKIDYKNWLKIGATFINKMKFKTHKKNIFDLFT